MIAAYDPSQSIAALVEQLATLLPARGQRVASAESCTGGLIAAACTERSGSSDWFERGFVTYSNAAKAETLGVDAGLIGTHGAVSAPVVEAMLSGTLAHSPADWAVAVSGVAGPGGGSADKPVGTVYIGWMARDGMAEVVRYQFDGDRGQVRQASVLAALVGLRERVDPCR
ncbi:CinA family protein [Salinisphaera sp. T31B1]|uniref:CinA family protein n=1 Tax=Salinisphaera sp. T31B1 TaxID=727963 RepID=UPI003341197A